MREKTSLEAEIFRSILPSVSGSQNEALAHCARRRKGDIRSD
jgi:hypothetical protein